MQRKEYLGKILKIFVLPTCVFHQNISIQVFKVTLYRCKQGGGGKLEKKNCASRKILHDSYAGFLRPPLNEKCVRLFIDKMDEVDVIRGCLYIGNLKYHRNKKVNNIQYWR